MLYIQFSYHFVKQLTVQKQKRAFLIPKKKKQISQINKQENNLNLPKLIAYCKFLYFSWCGQIQSMSLIAKAKRFGDPKKKIVDGEK
jgi:hypothetical protein